MAQDKAARSKCILIRIKKYINTMHNFVGTALMQCSIK